MKASNAMGGFSEQDRATVNKVSGELAKSLMDATREQIPMVREQYCVDAQLLRIVHANMFIRCTAAAAAEAYGLNEVDVGRHINEAIIELIRAKSNQENN
jgi:hypothetical protein